MQPFEVVQTAQPMPESRSQTSQFPVMGIEQRRGKFTSGLCDCLEDEETCWWGCWCPCLLTARTSQQYDLRSSSSYTLARGCCAFCCYAVIFACNPCLISLAEWFCYPIFQGNQRGKIREISGIEGNCLSDYCTFVCCCCSSCAQCQEAREAKAAGLKRIEYCTGEDISNIPVASIDSLHPTIDGSNGNGESLPITDEGQESNKMLYISKASKYLLVAGVLLFLLCITVLAMQKKGDSIFVLLLVFLQPILILYYFYWKPLRTTVALDYIIKLFAVGFFVTTFQAIVFEEIIQILCLVIGAAFIPDALKDDDVVDAPDSEGSAGVNGQYATSFLSSLLKTQLTATWDYVAPVLIPGGDKHQESSSDIDTNPNNTDIDVRNIINNNWGVVILASFVMAYVIAAGVEETMKHFIVRCQQFGGPLRSPYVITIFMVSGALGFATAENLSYVFSTRESPIPGTGILVGEITVLFLRVLMPIHLICAVFQGSNLTKIVMGQAPEMTLFKLLLPGLFLHGTFDFTLFVVGIYGYAHDIDTIGYHIMTFCIAIGIGFLGAFFARKEFNKVCSDYDYGWQQLSDDTGHSEADSPSMRV